MTRHIESHHVEGLPGLSRQAQARLLAEQPRTVRDALRIPGVGRKTTRHLLDEGVIDDPDGLQPGSRKRALDRPRVHTGADGDIVAIQVVEGGPDRHSALVEALADIVCEDLLMHPPSRR